MAYRNKTYVAFDGDEDICSYYLMKAWKQSDNTDFCFYDAHDLNNARDTSQEESIKKQLAERMKNSKTFVLLLGEKTKNLRKFVPWEIEHAIKLDLPIIVVNLNKKRNIDYERMPKLLSNKLCIVCSFNPKIMQYSLENWPKRHKELKLEKDIDPRPRYWKEKVYEKLGIV